MKQADFYHRALKEYKRQTGESPDCVLESKAVASASRESDIIDVTRTDCTVDKDWIEAIENGLIHVRKAIDEARQFIRSHGEVVPIEKVKRVSKDSVEHLARHSDLISREPKGDDLTPDKLYMVERLNDFAVYENRFLYMLLCYLKTFIRLRYDKILEISNTYRGAMQMNKTVVKAKRKLIFQLSLTDERRDDEYLKELNGLGSIIDRIDTIYKTVVFLLSTPLMQEASKAALLKPPITKTNVLKMNRNFKGAVALYDFVRGYDKAGYTVETHEERISPLPDNAAEELADATMLTAFLAYKYGLNLNATLEDSYKEEEENRRAAEAERIKAQLIQLKKRIDEEGGNPAEYMLLLEKRNKALEQDSADLAAAKQEIQKLNAEVKEMKENIARLTAALNEKQAEIAALNRKHTEEITALNNKHSEELNVLSRKFAEETAGLNRKHADELTTLKAEHNRQTAGLTEAHKDEVKALKEQQAREKQERKDAESALLKRISEQEAGYLAQTQDLNTLLNEKNIQHEALSAAKALSDSRLNALRKEYNLIGDDEDFTSEEQFSELERQFKVFKSFLKNEWKKSKKRIRREVLKGGAGGNAEGGTGENKSTEGN